MKLSSELTSVSEEESRDYGRNRRWRHYRHATVARGVFQDASPAIVASRFQAGRDRKHCSFHHCCDTCVKCFVSQIKLKLRMCEDCDSSRSSYSTLCLVPRNISRLPCHPSDKRKCGVAGIVPEQRKDSAPVPEMLWKYTRLTACLLSQVLVLAALVAAASAGGPAAYSTYTAPASYGSVGATHESTIKGYGGNSVISQYSKAVDSAYSSVRKYDTRISNDAQALAYAPAYAPASYAAPAIASYGGYAAPALAARAYAAPAISAYGGYAAPALAARAYGAPAIASYGGYAAPALAARAYGAPAIASYGGYAVGLGANYGW
uniref:Uncharacterized protein n=1 Tax=Timema shepardi TaxID=629360 RepID=A0A7R9FZW6_TIMSH|nr:unnamed protein product [Timema shepardi]